MQTNGLLNFLFSIVKYAGLRVRCFLWIGTHVMVKFFPLTRWLSGSNNTNCIITSKPLFLRKQSFLLLSAGWPVRWEGATTFGVKLISGLPLSLQWHLRWNALFRVSMTIPLFSALSMDRSLCKIVCKPEDCSMTFPLKSFKFPTSQWRDGWHNFFSFFKVLYALNSTVAFFLAMWLYAHARLAKFALHSWR